MTYLTSVANGVADGGSTTHDSSSLTVSGSNKVMFVYVGCSDGTPATPTSVVWDPTGVNQSLTQIGSSATYGTFGNGSMWRLTAPSNATGIVRATWAATKGERLIEVWVETSIDQTTPIGTVVSATGTASTVASGAVTTTAGQRILNFASALRNATFSGPTEFDSPTGTERQDGVTSGTAFQAFAAQEQTASGSSTSPTWTLNEGVDGWASFAFALNASSGTTPNITSTSTATPANGSSMTITGTNFGASQGSGSVTINSQTQSVTSWADTSITITVSRGNSKYGAATVVVTDNALSSSSPYALTALTPQSGWSYVDLGTINTTAYNRLKADPDLASGDQIAYESPSGTVTVNADATFSASTSITSFQFEVWSTTWGSLATQVLTPTAYPPALASDLELASKYADFISSLNPQTWFGPIATEKWFADELTASAANPDVTLALTGVSATGAVGSLGDAVSCALTGNQATGQVGNVGDSISFALTGNQATGQAGSVKSDISYALTGNQATGAVGTVSAGSDISLALTGVSATGQVGSLTANVSYALTGNQATGQVGTVTTGNDVSLALTGVAATGQVGTLSPALSVALTGVQASGQVGTATASLSFALSGNQSTGAVGSVGDAVSYALSGVQATGEVGTVSVVGDVTKALTGVEAVGQVGNVSIPTQDDRIAIRGWIGEDKRDVKKALKAGWGATVKDRLSQKATTEKSGTDNTDAVVSGVVETTEAQQKPAKSPKEREIDVVALAAEQAQNTKQVKEAAALITSVIEQAAIESAIAEERRRERIKSIVLAIAEQL